MAVHKYEASLYGFLRRYESAPAKHLHSSARGLCLMARWRKQRSKPSHWRFKVSSLHHAAWTRHFTS